MICEEGNGTNEGEDDYTDNYAGSCRRVNMYGKELEVPCIKSSHFGKLLIGIAWAISNIFRGLDHTPGFFAF